MTHASLPADIDFIAQELSRRNWQMGTAESCTGGGIAAALTDKPGSSQWFAGALVVYTIPWKEKFLGVPKEVIQTYSVYSQETVAAMLDGLQTRYALPVGLAVSGIAGPGGAEPGKPVGTVFLGAFAGPHRAFLRELYHGDRLAVRQQTVAAAIHLLAQLLQNFPTLS